MAKKKREEEDRSLAMPEPTGGLLDEMDSPDENTSVTYPRRTWPPLLKLDLWPLENDQVQAIACSELHRIKNRRFLEEMASVLRTVRHWEDKFPGRCGWTRRITLEFHYEDDGNTKAMKHVSSWGSRLPGDETEGPYDEELDTE